MAFKKAEIGTTLLTMAFGMISGQEELGQWISSASLAER